MPATLTRKPNKTLSSATENTYATAFATDLGVMAVAFEGNRLAKLTFDHKSERSAITSLGAKLSTQAPSRRQTAIIEKLVAYSAGEEVSFGEIDLVRPWSTPFSLRVIDACRAIPYGETLSYGEVAQIAGSPGAARAVGNIMASNPIPLVIPCHRVIGSHGCLGGYSARGGLAIKQRLLDMENAGKK